MDVTWNASNSVSKREKSSDINSLSTEGIYEYLLDMSEHIFV